MLSNNEIQTDLGKLTEAIEARKEAELERKRAEEERIELEGERLEKISANSELLHSIAAAVESLAILMDSIEPTLASQSRQIDIIFEFMRIIVGWLSTQGYKEVDRLDDILRDIGRQSMQIDIHADRDVNTGDIVDGENTHIEFDCIGTIRLIQSELEEGNIGHAEKLFSSLPTDAVDIAIAALQSPLQAAMVVVEKIGDKIRLVRE